MNNEIKVLIFVGKPGVYDNTLISSDVLQASCRWLYGRPVEINGSRIGQIDSATWTGKNILCRATIWPEKLSKEQQEAMRVAAMGHIQAQGGDFDVIASPQAGSFNGESYQKQASSLMWQSVRLQLPLKTHSASVLETTTRNWFNGLGRKDV